MTDVGNLMDGANTFGDRLKAIRGFLRLPRHVFASHLGIPAATLKTWELSKVEISDPQLNKLLNALAKEKIPCSAEWLLEGTGPSPFSTPDVSNDSAAPSGVYAEQDCFLKNNPGALIQVVPNDQMSPYFTKGDYVGGVQANLEESDGKNAFIVYVKDKPEPFIRFLNKDASGHFSLTHANLSEFGHGFMVNVDIQEAYKIIWHRKAL